jgi:hypothetical protein
MLESQCTSDLCELSNDSSRFTEGEDIRNQISHC